MALEYQLLLYILEAGLVGLASGVLLARLGGKPCSTTDDAGGADQSREKDTLGPIGLERALAARFYSDLRRSIREGLVKPVLTSDHCPGRVVYDFVSMQWMCIDGSGNASPLGEPPSLERLELEGLETGEGE